MKQIFFGICVSLLGSMSVDAQAKPKAPAAKPAKVAAAVAGKSPARKAAPGRQKVRKAG